MEDGPQKPVRVVQTTGTIDAIREFIRSRHQNGFLNLENMAQDDILRSAKIIPPGSSTGRNDVGAVMMKVAAGLFPDVSRKICWESISLKYATALTDRFLVFTVYVDHYHLIRFKWTPVTCPHFVRRPVFSKHPQSFIQRKRNSQLQGS